MKSSLDRVVRVTDIQERATTHSRDCTRFSRTLTPRQLEERQESDRRMEVRSRKVETQQARQAEFNANYQQGGYGEGGIVDEQVLATLSREWVATPVIARSVLIDTTTAGKSLNRLVARGIARRRFAVQQSGNPVEWRLA